MSYSGNDSQEVSIFEELDVVEDDSTGTGGDERSGTNTSVEHTTKEEGERLVLISKAAVFLVLLLSALIVGSVARRLLKKDESSDFNRQVRGGTGTLL